MSVTLCELTLPAVPESLPAFEELAHGVIAARHAIAAPGKRKMRLLSISFSSRARSVQQLSMIVRCAAEIARQPAALIGADFAELKLLTSHRFQIAKTAKGIISAKVSRTPQLSLQRIKTPPAALTLQEVEQLRKVLWLYQLAKAWKRVEFQALDDDEAILHLSLPRVAETGVGRPLVRKRR